jgi:hypothetical protein
VIPSKGDNSKFQALRTIISQGVIDIPPKHAPHITLMHPRNSNCTDEIFDQIVKMDFPVRLTFQKISLIQQAENSPWKIIREFDLKIKAKTHFRSELPEICNWPLGYIRAIAKISCIANDKTCTATSLCKE